MNEWESRHRDEEYIPVLEVGGTHVTAAWVDPDGWQVSDLRRSPLRADGSASELLGDLVRAGTRLGAGPGASWAVAMPGPFDYVRGVGRYTGVGKFEGLAGVDIRSTLYEELPHRPASISFSNDASAFLIGEWLIGAARGATRCAAVTLGTGIGSAFLDNGRVVDSGPSVPPEAELHLLLHRDRPLEDWVSRRALLGAYAAALSAGTPPGGAIPPAGAQAAVPPGGIDVEQLAELARAGDRAASTAFSESFLLLGEVLGPWLERFGADMLVIGGSISAAWDLIAKPLSRGLSRYSDRRFGIGPAEQPELAPLVGAAYPAS